jgi:hypothetical protein
LLVDSVNPFVILHKLSAAITQRRLMARKTAIIDILKSFDHHRSKFILARLAGQQKALCEFYLTSKKPENVEDAQLAIGAEGNSFASVKSQLETSVLTLLGEYLEKGTIKQRLSGLMQQATACLALNHIGGAREVFDKALKMAVKIEDWITAISIDSTLRSYFRDSLDASDWQRSVELSHCLEEYTNTYRWLILAEAAKATNGDNRRSKAIELLDLLRGIRPNTKKGEIFHSRATAICLVLSSEFEEANELLGSAYGRLKTANDCLHDPIALASAIAIVVAHATNIINNGAADHARNVIDKFKIQLDGIQLPMPPTLEYVSCICDIMTCDMKSDPAKSLDEICHRFERVLAASEIVDYRRSVAIQVIACARLIDSGLFKVALKRLETIRKPRRSDAADRWLAIASCMELACNTELENLDGLEQAIRRATKRLQLPHASIKVREIILSAFKEIAASSGEPSYILYKMGQSLSPYRNLDPDRHILNGFDLIGWATLMR